MLVKGRGEGRRVQGIVLFQTIKTNVSVLYPFKSFLPTYPVCFEFSFILNRLLCRTDLGEVLHRA